MEDFEQDFAAAIKAKKTIFYLASNPKKIIDSKYQEAKKFKEDFINKYGLGQWKEVPLDYNTR